MNVLGIEFSSDKLTYVLLVSDGTGFKIEQFNRLQLTETRSRTSLRAFQDAVVAMLNSTQPSVIAIKNKPVLG